MVKADPASASFIDIPLEGGYGCWFPTVGCVIQLDKELIVGKELIGQGIGAGDVIDDEIAVGGKVIQPASCTPGKGGVPSAILIDGEGMKTRLVDLLIQVIHSCRH